MRILLLNCLMVLWGLAAFGQADSLLKATPQDLPKELCVEPVVVEASWILTPGTARLERGLLRQGGHSSIETALSIVPGVRFESRGYGGSRRLTLRGSLLRSPFGVRGLKAYLDGLPLSSPDGNTPLELIDADLLRRVNVMRGPQCGLYGPGSGGVLDIWSGFPGRESTPHPVGGTAQAVLGGYGYFRGLASVRLGGRNSATGISYVRQAFAGYRAQEGNEKHMLQANTQFALGRHALRVNAIAYRGGWELPGGLNDSIAAVDPRAALPYSIMAKAAVQRDWLRVAAHDEWHTDKVTQRNGIYYQGTQKTNPYGTSPAFQGYKVESAHGFGGRSELHYKVVRGLEIAHVVEAQFEPGRFAEYVNGAGEKGAQRAGYRLNSSAGLFSTQARANVGGFRALLSGSLNALGYDVQDEFASDSVDYSHVFAFPIVPQVQGSVARRFRIHRKLNLNTTLLAATAYSPPGVWEIMNEDGSQNRDLQPEHGLNLELIGEFTGEKGRAFTLRPYHFWLKDAILPYTDTLGRTRYANAASATQRGLEVEVEFPNIRAGAWSLSTRGSAALQDYRFTEFTSDSTDLQGKHLPGIPLWTLGCWINQDLLLGKLLLSLQSSLQVSGKTFLTNENDKAQSPYALLNLRLDANFKGLLKGEWAIPIIFIGVNNLLNSQYSNYLNLNDARRRYWNPAPGINLFGGMEISF